MSFKKRIEKIKDGLLSNSSEAIIDIRQKVNDAIIKGGDYKDALANFEDINIYYQYYVNHIIDMLKELQDNYDIKLDPEDDDISEEIKVLEKHYKKHNKVTINNKMLRVANIRKYNIAVNKWRVVSECSKLMPKVLKYYKKCTKQQYTYKDDIQDTLLESEKYNQSFKHFKREGNKIKWTPQ